MKFMKKMLKQQKIFLTLWKTGDKYNLTVTKFKQIQQMI